MMFSEYETWDRERAAYEKALGVVIAERDTLREQLAECGRLRDAAMRHVGTVATSSMLDQDLLQLRYVVDASMLRAGGMQVFDHALSEARAHWQRWLDKDGTAVTP